MDTIESNESPKRRLEDRVPDATLDWTKPGAPAVPAAPAVPRSATLRAVASMSVSPSGVSVFPTPAAAALEHGHYMLSVPGARSQAAAVPPTRAAAPAAIFKGYNGDTGAPIVKLLGQINASDLLYVARQIAAPSGPTPEIDALTAARDRDAAQPVEADNLRKALSRAFRFGQTYWQQADSESTREHAKSRATLGEFDAFVDAACARFVAKPVEAASQITDLDSARAFLDAWHRKHFPTDRTFSRYIMADPARSNPLAGDFAWQLAKALEAMGAAPTESAAAPADTQEQKLIEKRIELIPEYEGEWRAYVYLDSEEPCATAAGPTPSAAVDAALDRASRPTPTKGNGDTDTGEAS